MSKLIKIILPVLILSVIIPSVAFASWWNPFSWGWADFFSHLLSLNATSESISAPGNNVNDIKNTEDNCSGISVESDYLGKSFWSFDDAYKIAFDQAGQDINSQSKNLDKINKLRALVKNESRQLKYFNQGKWQAVKDDFLKAADSLAQDKGTFDNGASNYRQEAYSIYTDLEKGFPKIYNDCMSKK